VKKEAKPKPKQSHLQSQPQSSPQKDTRIDKKQRDLEARYERLSKLAGADKNEAFDSYRKAVIAKEKGTFYI